MPLCEATRSDGTACRAFAMHGAQLCAAHLRGSATFKTTQTPELIDGILVLLRAGNYVDVALRAVNVPRRTFYHWLSTDPRLRARVDEARAVGEARNVSAIAAAAQTSWQAAAWLLERQYPDRWGRVSVRLRDETIVPAAEPPPDPDDPFAEVDELAQRRAAR